MAQLEGSNTRLPLSRWLSISNISLPARLLAMPPISSRETLALRRCSAIGPDSNPDVPFGSQLVATVWCYLTVVRWLLYFTGVESGDYGPHL